MNKDIVYDIIHISYKKNLLFYTGQEGYTEKDSPRNHRNIRYSKVVFDIK